MKFLFFKPMLLCFIIAIFGAGQSASGQSPPNIVMIVVDDLNNWVGYLGGPRITPNMDRLASTSHQFLNAFAVVPTCNASRVAMLTGLRPSVTGVFGNVENFRHRTGGNERLTLPEYFRQQRGYETVAAGKIFHHQRGVGVTPPPLSDPRSWDIQQTGYSGTNGISFYLDREGRAFWLEGSSSGNRYLDSFGVWAEARTHTGALQKTVETGDWLHAQYAVDYLAQDHDAPFFLAVGIKRPHAPLLATKEFLDWHDARYHFGTPLPELPENDLDDVPRIVRENFTTPFTEMMLQREQLPKAVRSYLALVSFVDSAIGHVVDAVGNSQYADNTIIVVTSDHGFQLGHKRRWEKFELWRQAMHVPLLIKLPGQTESTRIGQSVSLLDIYPTMVELAELPPNQNLNGRSLTGLMNDPDSEPIRAVVQNGFGWDGNRNEYSVHQDGWHYIRRRNGAEELYDHVADPREFVNLAQLQQYESRKRQLGTELAKTAIRVGNRSVAVESVNTSGTKISDSFSGTRGSLSSRNRWETVRFGSRESQRDFLLRANKLASVPGRVLSVVDDIRLRGADDFVMATDLKFRNDGVGGGIVFGLTDRDNYFELLLIDGRFGPNQNKDVVLRRWTNGVPRTLVVESGLENVARNRRYTLVADYDSRRNRLEFMALDARKNVYFRKSAELVLPANSQFGVSSFYHAYSEFDNFRLLVHPRHSDEATYQPPEDVFADIYDGEYFSSFDDIEIGFLGDLDADWTLQRSGTGLDFDFTAYNSIVESGPGRMLATRDACFLHDGEDFLLTSKLRFTSGGISAGVVFGYEDDENYYEFQLVDGQLEQNNGQDVGLYRWFRGQRFPVLGAYSLPEIEYGRDSLLVLDYNAGSRRLQLAVKDAETNEVIFYRDVYFEVPVDSQFGISSYYHANCKWDFFRVLIGDDAGIKNEVALGIEGIE